MKRSGQILLELLVAGILLVLVVPRVAPITWKYAGPNWTQYEGMLTANRAQIALNESNAAFASARMKLAAIKASQSAREQSVESQEAPRLFDIFSNRQASLFAQCLTEAKGRMTQAQKNHMIELVFSSAPEVTNCKDLRRVQPQNYAQR